MNTAVTRVRTRPYPSDEGASGLGLVAWLAGILFFLPIAWMTLTSFHSEEDAATNPPSLAASLTLDGYRDFFGTGGGASPWPALINSTVASVASTLLVLLLALPAAYALSIRPVKKWTDVLFFFLSTKMLPVVAGLLPIYLFAKNAEMLDNIWLLVILYTVDEPADRGVDDAVLPRRGPVAIIEAAQIDGARLPTILARVVAPIALPGIAATALICFIFSWNELLFARVLTGRRRPDRTRLPDRLHHQPGPVPGEGVRRGARDLPAGARRGVRRPGQAGPGPVAGSRQVKAAIIESVGKASSRGRPTPPPGRARSSSRSRRADCAGPICTSSRASSRPTLPVVPGPRVRRGGRRRRQRGHANSPSATGSRSTPRCTASSATTAAPATTTSANGGPRSASPRRRRRRVRGRARRQLRTPARPRPHRGRGAHRAAVLRRARLRRAARPARRPRADLRLRDHGPDDAGARQADRRGERRRRGPQPGPPRHGAAAGLSRGLPPPPTNSPRRRAGTSSSTPRATPAAIQDGLGPGRQGRHVPAVRGRRLRDAGHASTRTGSTTRRSRSPARWRCCTATSGRRSCSPAASSTRTSSSATGCRWRRTRRLWTGSPPGGPEDRGGAVAAAPCIHRLRRRSGWNFQRVRRVQTLWREKSSAGKGTAKPGRSLPRA